eukprot:scaffold21459_cov33-Tisochrysis_lutea.AAC.1
MRQSLDAVVCTPFARVVHLARIVDNPRRDVRLVEHGQLDKHLWVLCPAFEMVWVAPSWLPVVWVEHGHELVEHARIKEKELVDGDHTA